MKISNIKRICGLLFAALLFSCLVACGRQDEQPVQMVQTPEPTEEVEPEQTEQAVERPELVEPELQPSSLINGDFEQNFDEYGALPGWNVEFSEWGEGEAAASFSLSTEKDNTPNTTQKLSLYNGLAKPVEFTVSQTVENLEAGEYIVSCIFEGGPADTATRTKLTVNGSATEFGSYAGWKNWQQIKSRTFTVERGGTVSIEISGTMKSKDWMDLDDIELTLSSEFQPRAFAKFGDEAIDGVIYDCLTNGDFETGEDANGLLPGWTVEFANWGSDEARAAYRLTTEYDNINTSQKLSLGNDTGADNPFTITQKFRTPGAGQYVIAVDWEGKPGQTDFYLNVNGKRVPFGKAEGWKNWAQAASEPFTVKSGDVVIVEIGGTMGIDGWMDIDNVIFVAAADFVPKQFTKVVSGGSSYSAPAPLKFVTMDHIQNGDFSKGVIWTHAGNPDGYLPGWILPRIDWGTWKYNVVKGEFTLTNISDSANASTFELKQFVNLAPGCYTLNAWSGWKWDANNSEGITMSVKADGNVLASVKKNPGRGDLVTNDFTLMETTTVEVSFVFSLRGQANLGLDNVEFRPYPAPIKWQSAEQIGGASGTADTTGIRLKFDKNIPDLDATNFTVTGAATGGLKRTDIGEYELTLSGITVADGGSVTVSVNKDSLPGYIFDSESKNVEVYKAAQQPTPTFKDPIKNGDFAKCDVWPVPNGWTLMIGSYAIDGYNNHKAWSDNSNGSTVGITDGTAGVSFWGATEDALQDFSLSQTIELEPGTYRLSYTLTDSSWGLTFGIAEITGASKMETTGSGNASGSVEFTVTTKGTYTVTISKSGNGATWVNDYFKLESVTLEKLSD